MYRYFDAEHQMQLEFWIDSALDLNEVDVEFRTLR